jgi:RNA polymerase sigma factor (TIGR02999 family)
MMENMSYMSQQEHDITNLLKAWRSGDKESLRLLISLVYNKLRGMAHNQLQQEWGSTGLETTELVHRAFTAMLDQDQINWQDRDHFFRVTARAMRRVLIDDARNRMRLKRGGGQLDETFDETDAHFVTKLDSEQLVILDRAMDDLVKEDNDAAQIIELRFFGGFTTSEIARILNISERTVKAKAKFAKAWLFQQLQGD